MAKVLKDPPPFNLTQSVLPKEYLTLIITKGGAELKRSGKMPPWGDQLNALEIEAVADYIISLRH
jgi:cytochrome c oxidase cbb3-type subunit 3